jgi:predicted nucleic-acid-binding protein
MINPTKENASGEAGVIVAGSQADATEQSVPRSSDGSTASLGIETRPRSTVETLPIDAIRIDGGTQSRVSLNETTVSEYAEIIRFGGDLPPVLVFEDGADIWLADGFHRYHAHRAAGAMEIACEVRKGTKRDAVLYSVGANASHGLRRSNEDKRRAVMTLLNDAEWSVWSDSAIAKACRVDHKTVAAHRASILGISQDTALVVRTVERNGKTYEQNVSNIGKAKPAAYIQPQEAQPIATVNAETVEVARDAMSELQEQIAELQASLKETLADNELMGRVFDADDRLQAAMDEAKRQKAIADNAERTLAAKTGEFNERARAVTYWKNRAEKAEKSLKVAA